MRFLSISNGIYVVATTCLVGILSGCESTEEEQAVLSVVQNGTALLEKGDATNALRLTTADFRVQPGRLSRKTVMARVSAFYRMHGDIEILHPTPDVEFLESGKVALVTAPFVAAEKGVARQALDALADDPEAWEKLASDLTTVEHAEISLVKKNDRWLVSSVRF